jgi:DNA topoisomerase-3
MLPLEELEMRQGNTSSPSLLSESDLIGLMDKSGIGTDATIHEHIKKILDREYAVKSGGGLFSPTTLGVALVEAYDEMEIDLSLAKPHLRSVMEANMRGICDSVKTKDDVVRQVVRMYKDAFFVADQQSYLFERVRKKNGRKGGRREGDIEFSVF